MSFIKTHFKIILSLIILIALLCAVWLYFSKPKKIEKQIEGVAGTIDTTTPHPADVMIRFSREYNGMNYQDALNLTQKEYDALTKEQILKMEDERFNNWVKTITTQ